jgi:PAS domain S-box-containing protein
LKNNINTRIRSIIIKGSSEIKMKENSDLNSQQRSWQNEALKESEERFNKAFHSSPVAMVITKVSDGTFIEVNESYERLMGYSRQEIIGHKSTEINFYVDPGQRDELIRLLTEKGKIKDKEMTFRKKDGQLIETIGSVEVISGTVTILCDRDIQGNGIKVKFLGKETSFPVGVVDLALRTGAAIVPIFSLRKTNNTTSIFVEAPLKLSDIQDHDPALRDSLKSLVAIIEDYIHTYPEQWVVLDPN